MKAKPTRECCKRVARVHVKAMADQIQAHHRTITVLVLRITTVESAIADALKLIDAQRTNTWTPADDLVLAEIRALAKGL